MNESNETNQTTPQNPESKQTPETSTQPAATSGSKMIIILVILAVALGGLFYWWTSTSDPVANNPDGTELTAAAGDAAISSVDDIPDVVAVVNGAEVTKEAYLQNITQLQALASQQGIDLNNASVVSQLLQQALEQSVNNELIAQAAAEANVSVSAETVEAELARLRSQFADEAEFIAEVEAAGLTVETLRANIAEQLVLDEYVNESVLADLPAVTEADAREVYDSIEVQEGTELPSFAELQAQIEAQINQQNQQEAITELIASLREGADIEVNI